MTLSPAPTKPRIRVKAGSRQIAEQNSSRTVQTRETDKAGTGSSPVSATPGEWRTRDLNTVIRDPAALITVATAQRKPLRPFCQHPDDLAKCAGSGSNHCWACRKQMVVA